MPKPNQRKQSNMANGTNDAAGAAPKVKKTRAPAKKRPVYVVYSSDTDGNIVIHTMTRKADEVLALTAGQSEKKYALAEV